MADFQIRSDNVDVEQIMGQIRARIREKRGVDYTEEEIRELASVKLEKFLDPRGLRSDLLQQFRQGRAALPAPPNYAFEDSTLFESNRGIVRFIRKLLKPILKLFFNPNPLIQALHIQADLNARNVKREEVEVLYYELLHNLVLETTRLGIETKNLKMRLESMSSRLDFDERRARALEGVVQYRPGSVPPLQPPAAARSGGGAPAAGGGPESAESQEARRTRRRRRRGRKPGDGRPGENRFGGGGQDQPRGNASDSLSASADPAFVRNEPRADFGEAGSGPVSTEASSRSTEPVSPKPQSEGGGEGG